MVDVCVAELYCVPVNVGQTYFFRRSWAYFFYVGFGCRTDILILVCRFTFSTAVRPFRLTYDSDIQTSLLLFLAVCVSR